MKRRDAPLPRLSRRGGHPLRSRGNRLGMTFLATRETRHFYFIQHRTPLGHVYPDPSDSPSFFSILVS